MDFADGLGQRLGQRRDPGGEPAAIAGLGKGHRAQRDRVLDQVGRGRRDQSLDEDPAIPPGSVRVDLAADEAHGQLLVGGLPVPLCGHAELDLEVGLAAERHARVGNCDGVARRGGEDAHVTGGRRSRGGHDQVHVRIRGGDGPGAIDEPAAGIGVGVVGEVPAVEAPLTGLDRAVVRRVARREDDRTAAATTAAARRVLQLVEVVRDLRGRRCRGRERREQAHTCCRCWPGCSAVVRRGKVERQRLPLVRHGRERVLFEVDGAVRGRFRAYRRTRWPAAGAYTRKVTTLFAARAIAGTDLFASTV